MIDMNNIHPYHPLPDKSRRRSSQRKLDLQDSAADGPDARASRIARLSNEVQTSILSPLSEAPIPSRLPSLAPSMAVSPIPTHNQSLQFNHKPVDAYFHEISRDLVQMSGKSACSGGKYPGGEQDGHSIMTHNSRKGSSPTPPTSIASLDSR